MNQNLIHISCNDFTGSILVTRKWNLTCWKRVPAAYMKYLNVSYFFVVTGDKPHACELCHKKFALACNLRAHMKTHEGECLAGSENSLKHLCVSYMQLSSWYAATLLCQLYATVVLIRCNGQLTFCTCIRGNNWFGSWSGHRSSWGPSRFFSVSSVKLHLQTYQGVLNLIHPSFLAVSPLYSTLFNVTEKCY
jgi:hypothetical protein